MNSVVAECKNNIDGDPLFVDKTNGDYRLRFGSPAINSGDPGSPFDADGSRADIGALYYTPVTTIPSAPSLSSPANNANLQPTTLSLSWGSSAGATKYHLQVSITSAFSSLVVNDSSLSGTSKSVGPLVNNTTYYWRVRAGNSGGWSAFSASWSFTTIGTLPSIPTLVSPSNGASGVSMSPTLTWNSDSGAASYTLQVSTSATFATNIIDQTGLAGASFTASGLATNTVYYWRVNAANPAGTSGWSTAWSFTTSASARLPGEYATDASTVLLLHMNETSGSVLNDASTYSSSGLAIGTTIVDGRFGKTRSFNGVSERISIPSSTVLNVSPNLTLEAWIKMAAFSGNNMVLRKNGPNEQNGYYLGFAGSGTILHMAVNTKMGLGTNTTINPALFLDGKWHHIAGTYDGSAARVYIDGVLIDQDVFGVTIGTNSTDPVSIGANDVYGEYLNGLIDEVRISNKARAPDEFNLQLPPTTLKTTPSGTTINLSWQNGGGAVGLLRYKIYRGADSTSVSLIDSTTSLIYSSVGLISGAKYFYRVSAVDSTGFEGAKSYAASALISSSLVVTTTAATNITGTSATVNGSVNPAGLATTIWFEWGVDSLFRAYSSTPSQSIGSGTSAISVTANLSGLNQNRKYYYRVVAQNSGGTSSGSALSFTTTPPLPAVTTASASSITSTTAVLNGTVNPSGALTAASFEWGTISTLSSAASTTSRSIGSGTSDVAVADTLSGLNANTTYYYRAVGVNGAGTQKGSIVSFTTKGAGVAPTVTTGSPMSISTTSATLTGSVNPNGLSTSVVFQYGTSTGYGNQVTATQSPVNGASAVSVSALLSGLSAGTTYHYRVVATNSAGTANGVDQTFVSYSTSLTASTNVSFPAKAKSSDYSATDYKLVGLPGASDLAVNSIFAGTRNIDWQAYWDNGAATNYLVEFDASSTFRFTVGHAFWIISKGALSVSRTVTSASLNASQEVEIPLNAGWNLITNPYTSAISWSKVQSANGINAPIYTYSGSFSTSTTFDPYVGYYLFNGSPNTTLTTLKVPYASVFSKTADVKDLVPGDWEVGVLLSAGEITDGGTSFGVSRQARSGLDHLDFRKPRGLSTTTAAYFERSEWDPDYPAFATDIRREVNEVERWDFTAVCIVSEPSTVMFSGIRGVPNGLEVYLIDEARAKSINLRRDSTYQFVPLTAISKFSVIVGSMEMIGPKLREIGPKEFLLSQNFPNPFNPSTSFSVDVPRATMITLKIYNTLGEEVRTLQAGVLQPGRHWFQWDARDESRNSLPSGAYFCRMTSPEGKSLVTRMLLVK
ncbi:MAG: hypothetical protein A2X66_07410 [Ignavibacteria bacterium GWA2_54_16]|nr:MAG: hypothetical protein A2X66_07410 [Ignavibacteria bacterium GWA2_54_16]